MDVMNWLEGGIVMLLMTIISSSFKTYPYLALDIQRRSKPEGKERRGNETNG